MRARYTEAAAPTAAKAGAALACTTAPQPKRRPHSLIVSLTEGFVLGRNRFGIWVDAAPLGPHNRAPLGDTSGCNARGLAPRGMAPLAKRHQLTDICFQERCFQNREDLCIGPRSPRPQLAIRALQVNHGSLRVEISEGVHRQARGEKRARENPFRVLAAQPTRSGVSNRTFRPP